MKRGPADTPGIVAAGPALNATSSPASLILWVTERTSAARGLRARLSQVGKGRPVKRGNEKLKPHSILLAVIPPGQPSALQNTPTWEWFRQGSLRRAE